MTKKMARMTSGSTQWSTKRIKKSSKQVVPAQELPIPAPDPVQTMARAFRVAHEVGLDVGDMLRLVKAFSALPKQVDPLGAFTQIAEAARAAKVDIEKALRYFIAIGMEHRSTVPPVVTKG